jgi:hypothetical protein
VQILFDVVLAVEITSRAEKAKDAPSAPFAMDNKCIDEMCAEIHHSAEEGNAI